jgi:hypothetical protein
MILVDKFLLPADADDAQRQAIVHQRMRKCRGVSGRVIAVLPVKMAGSDSSATRARPSTSA